ncbi:serine carboxypeptidase-like 45 isoform X2 [Mercurialis annua]|uniref:serine carboxypeptidase-like 45 isoform X2 n=1 Tax=Mercurialis annua TaxID=3986 RepID=UPI0021602EC8|nr:serine carboxypeptidase-like 45 isoform X2 [Mercurialis annua]
MNLHSPSESVFRLFNYNMHTRPWIAMLIICITLMQNRAVVGFSSKEDDKLASLPGQRQVSFHQYAGYITVDETQQRALFYYFVEAEVDPASKPLVLWLNGGPGCSSLGGGAFTEHGPFRPVDGDNLILNEYSWNKEANMLYLEAPAGVGFSYSANKTFYDYVNDTMTAQDNLEFLKQWFVKFPEYTNREFYISGESYAGHYVPQLASLVVESGLKFSLKAILIGNPLLEFDTDLNSQGDYYWSHGLISDSTYQLVNSVCNTSQLMRGYIIGSLSPACQAVNRLLLSEYPDAIDPYDVTADVCPSNLQSLLFNSQNHPLTSKFQLSSLYNIAQTDSNQPEASEKVDLCLPNKVAQYLNKKDVQAALHAKLLGISNWIACNRVLKYDMENLEIPTIDVVGSLVSSGIRVLVYSGDQDTVIPFIGSRTLVADLAKKLKINSSTTYKGWLEKKMRVRQIVKLIIVVLFNLKMFTEI